MNDADSKKTFVTLTRGKTHYELAGPSDGRVVVLLHGGTIPMWSWDSQVTALVKAGYRVLRYDMFARGDSDPVGVPYDRELYRVQLLELLDRLELSEPVDLVGVSFGGGTSANFTVRHPDRVGRLTLIAPVVDYKKGKTMLRLLQAPWIGELLMRHIGLGIIEKRAGRFFETLDEADRFKRLFEKQIRSDHFFRAFLSMIRTDALGDYRAIYRRLGEQERPKMLLWGTADEEIPRESIEYLREVLPGVEYHALEGVTHGSVAEAPDRINALLVAFLSKDRPRGT